ncbi:virulence factor BrkB family protein [Vibrio sp. WJH972]
MKFKRMVFGVRSYLFYLYRRMQHDRISVNAGYLAYITLISIVPMLTVLLSVLSTFSIFSGAGDVIQSFVINNFVPAAGDAVSDALSNFVANTGKMSAVGGGFLFVAAVTLISNIDKTLNYIWRVKEKRSWVLSLSMYWMILTLGPLLVGASLAVSSYLTSTQLLENAAVSGAYSVLLAGLPFLISLVLFTGLYLLVPNMSVKFRHAMFGALIAAILFEASKKGFALYITNFPSYQLIYGALAAIPILFVWVYLSWLIVLLGAEVTASSGEEEQWREDSNIMVNSTSISQNQEKGPTCDSLDSKG